jgi:putative inorganic carbon (HCO3(-)) transporter
MRDILLSLIVGGLLPLALRRPAIGALMWAWISIMNPHQLTHGFARTVPWAQIIAAVTLLGFIFSSQRKRMPLNGGTVLLAMLLVWVTVTSVFALNPNPNEVWDRWIFCMKIFVMLFLTLMLLRGQKEINWLIWVVVISIGFYGVKGGIWTVLSGGGSRVWGPAGTMLEGNNELAVGLVLITPLVYYLRASSTNKWVRLGLLWGMVACAFSILGSQSRGAFLALVAMGFVLGLKGKYPIRTSIALALVGLVVVAFMPDAWSQRMGTIQTYNDDTSAMSRIWTWTTLWNAAVDRPLIGAGFRADNLFVFAKYGRIPGFEYHFGTVYVAHSIYFQALGEHGFPGLILYVGVGVWTWFAAGALAVKTKNDAEFGTWVPILMQMCQVGLLGFAAGGAFLSLMLLDLQYYLLAIVVLARATVTERDSSQGITQKTLSVAMAPNGV